MTKNMTSITRKTAAMLLWMVLTTTAPAAYYTLDGKRVYRPQQGVYIVRTGNNTYRKLVVK